MRIACSSALLIGSLLVFVPAQADSQKQIVGATEIIQVGKERLSFKARVDTGAKTSSIHAENIKLDLPGDPRGKPISFTLVNEKGESIKVRTTVDSVVEVRTSEKSERRYKVPILMEWKNSKKTVLVTLNDRKAMKYRLLLGRNWLHGDFIVDVEKNSED